MTEKRDEIVHGDAVRHSAARPRAALSTTGILPVAIQGQDAPDTHGRDAHATKAVPIASVFRPHSADGHSCETNPIRRGGAEDSGSARMREDNALRRHYEREMDV